MKDLDFFDYCGCADDIYTKPLQLQTSDDGSTSLWYLIPRELAVVSFALCGARVIHRITILRNGRFHLRLYGDYENPFTHTYYWASRIVSVFTAPQWQNIIIVEYIQGLPPQGEPFLREE